MDKFNEFLIGKFGKAVTERLINNNRLLTENIRKKNIKDQKHVVTQLKKLKSRLNLDFEIDDNDWAFDFPGWTGKLDFKNEHVRKYMVIGLEPHIEDFDFQITYGLSERTPLNNEKRFSIGQNDSILCKDGLTIWSNLFNLIATKETQKNVYKGRNEMMLMKFLNQFYITDLCHFAPQGEAKKIKDIDNWENKRFIVAKHFLEEEMKIINPEIIIAGNKVFKIVTRLLGVKQSQTTFKISVGKQSQSINFAQKDKLKIIGLPDIGSQLTHKTFWMRNLKQARDFLKIKKHI